MRHLAVALALILSASPALACAVAARVEVENRSGRLLRAAYIEHGTPHNQLPREGLRPGATATIMLPDCVGSFTIVVEFTDGTRVRHTGNQTGVVHRLTVR